MKNKEIAIASIFAVLFTAGIHAEDGAALFKSKGCAACHNPTMDQSAKGLGPSIAQIKTAYGADKAGLVSFLQGNGTAKVDPAKAAIMKAQLATIKSLPDASKTALAEFMLK